MQFRRNALFVFVLAVTVSSAPSERACSADRFRKYTDGPLTVKDFQGQVPDRRADADGFRPNALTVVSLRFELKYDGDVTASGTVVRLRDIEVYAVVITNKSWNTAKFDKELLDHEQGHFDITQACALEAQLELNKLLRSGRPPLGIGRDRESALDDLLAKVQKVIDEHTDVAFKLNKQYDEETNHGLVRDKQIEHRRQQLAKLESRAAELEEVAGN